MQSEAEGLARSLLDAWNRRDIDGFAALLHEDVVWYDCGMPSPPARGRDAVRAYSASVIEAFPDFTYEIREPVCVSADGNRCVFAWQITATATGWMRPPGFAPTGRRVSFPGVDILDANDGRIVSVESYFDVAVAAEQLSGLRVRPKPGSVHEILLVGAQRLLAAWLR